MNLFLLIFLIVLYIFIAILLCTIILLQKPDSSISIASMKQQSSRSENSLLLKSTIFIGSIFFLFSIWTNRYSQQYKKSYESSMEIKSSKINIENVL
jgi:protein translocase SecG subunit